MARARDAGFADLLELRLSVALVETSASGSRRLADPKEGRRMAESEGHLPPPAPKSEFENSPGQQGHVSVTSIGFSFYSGEFYASVTMLLKLTV